MGVIYLISTIILLITFILIKKTDKKINIVGFICVSIITLFCYNTFVCYVLTFFIIPITLKLLTIINLLLALIICMIIVLKKQLQKYTFYKIDLLYIILFLTVVLIIGYINFGFPFNIKYETSDPAVHYLASTMFSKSEFLLAAEKESDYLYGSLSTMKPMSYVNSGLIMKVLCNDLQFTECYNIFVCFGILILFLTGITMYSAMIGFTDKKEHRLWAFIISLVCMLGYPLNSLLFGFEYLSMGLLVICTIFCLINYYDKKILKLNWFIFIMALLNFGLFLSYYMFVPFVYPAQWIYFCIKNYTKNKKIVTKELVIILLITLLIPFVLGYIYCISPNIFRIFIGESSALNQQSTYLVNSGFKLNGYIYINLYSNMLLLLPLPIYLFIKDSKNSNLKNNLFEALLLFFVILFIIVLFFGYVFDKVSIYYLSKNYFALWIILLFCNYKALIEISKNSNYLPRLFITSYIFLAVICTVFSDVKMIDDALKNPDEDIFSVMEIFGSNKTLLFREKEKLNQEEIDILLCAKENLDYNTKIEVVSEGIPYYWSYQILKYINEEETTKEFDGQYKLNLKSYLVKNKINKVDYMIYFNRSEKFNELKDRLFENSEIIYENSAGGILKYNK